MDNIALYFCGLTFGYHQNFVLRLYFYVIYSVIKEQFHEVSKFEITDTSTERSATMTPSN